MMLASIYSNIHTSPPQERTAHNYREDGRHPIQEDASHLSPGDSIPGTPTWLQRNQPHLSPIANKHLALSEYVYQEQAKRKKIGTHICSLIYL
jgi:hypothetical protein